jgi:hypothetical protein
LSQPPAVVLAGTRPVVRNLLAQHRLHFVHRT